MERTRVFVAGPLSQGDVAMNVKRAIRTAADLLSEGYAPFVPHLTHFWHMIAPSTRDVWLKLDREYLRWCHALLRLAGDSEGADQEEAWAKELGIPIFTSMWDLRKEMPAQRDQVPLHHREEAELRNLRARFKALEEAGLPVNTDPGCLEISLEEFLVRAETFYLGKKQH